MDAAGVSLRHPPGTATKPSATAPTLGYARCVAEDDTPTAAGYQACVRLFPLDPY
jgi:hypothetical protein